MELKRNAQQAVAEAEELEVEEENNGKGVEQARRVAECSIYGEYAANG